MFRDGVRKVSMPVAAGETAMVRATRAGARIYLS
jgi:hypothetical protein